MDSEKYTKKSYKPNNFFMPLALLEQVQHAQDLASLPTVAAHLLQLLERDDVDMRTIAQHVERDVAIATKVIRMANSPAFGLRSPVTSITQAIMTIGLSRVTNIVLSVSIFSKFVYLNTLAGEFLNKFWIHSAVTASMARSLAQRYGMQFQEVEFLAGLVHDIGKLVMLQIDAERFKQVRTKIENGADELETETLIFGATHAEIGEVVANLWKLPPIVQGTIRHHHDESHATDKVLPLVTLIRLVDLIAEEFDCGIGEHIHVPLEEQECWKQFCCLSQCSQDDIAQVRQHLREEISTALSLLETLRS